MMTLMTVMINYITITILLLFKPSEAFVFHRLYCGFFWMSTARYCQINIELKNYKEQ